MVEYRAYVVGDNGHFIDVQPLVCAGDTEAIEIAKQLVKDCPIELWRGEHFVIRLMPV